MFWRNNSFLGVAFTDIDIGQNRAYFPAVSMQKGQRVQFNFGQKPFTHVLSFSSIAMNEPDCQINGYHTTVLTLLDKLKKFLIAIEKFNKSCPIDERMAVGCLLFEYLLPMTEDAYVMEITVDFLEDTMAIKE